MLISIFSILPIVLDVLRVLDEEQARPFEKVSLSKFDSFSSCFSTLIRFFSKFLSKVDFQSLNIFLSF